MTTVRTLLADCATATGDIALTDGQHTLTVSPVVAVDLAAMLLHCGGLHYADTLIVWSEMDRTGAIAEIIDEYDNTAARVEVLVDGVYRLCDGDGCYSRVEDRMPRCSDHFGESIATAIHQLNEDRWYLDRREAELVAAARQRMAPDAVIGLFAKHGSANDRVKAIARNR
ncbi:hypothetical protein [Streptomyces sp. UNOC14_S4]|uniref:hypothetical protein n=1 Tax=Streptomyces sp. UNOC14_S4 TaxID=2872340 RepID=UPI001E313C1D|nr:hypothetical protein [Streptomyces sp. UNOC14_S4]MCC3765991.1 hypothetical protein [Streptomyces sp. UNOC14_S4]